MHVARIFAVSYVTLALASNSLAADRLNVLLICVDDLKPVLGCYGEQHAHAPTLGIYDSARTSAKRRPTPSGR